MDHPSSLPQVREKTRRAEKSKISNLLSPWEEKLIETLEIHLEEAEKRNQNLFVGAKLTKTFH